MSFVKLARTANFVRITEHFIPMRYPAGRSGRCEYHCEQACWNADSLEDDSRVEVDVRVELALHLCTHAMHVPYT